MFIQEQSVGSVGLNDDIFYLGTLELRHVKTLHENHPTNPKLSCFINTAVRINHFSIKLTGIQRILYGKLVKNL